VILVGAGATFGTLNRKHAPISKDFGKYLNEQIPQWKDRYRYLDASVEFLSKRYPNMNEKDWALDKVWGGIDDRWKLREIWSLDLPGATSPTPTTKKFYSRNINPWLIAGLELKCALARVYGELLQSPIEKAAQSKDGTFKKKLGELKGGDCVISFNYDLLTEKLLEKKYYALAGPKGENTEVKDKVLLCKPHGSVSWKRWVPENGRRVEILDDPLRESCIDSLDGENREVQPGIIAPVPHKDEFFFPEPTRSDCPSFSELLTAQWKTAIECIAMTDRLIVMGYGFPLEDTHVQHMFREAAAKRTKELYVELYEKDNEVGTKIANIFKKVTISFCGMVKPGEAP